jgi:flagellar biosynthesis protein FlhA
MVDPLGMEVGYRLITLVDRAQNGELLGRIKSIRKKIAQDIGFWCRWSISATTWN